MTADEVVEKGARRLHELGNRAAQRGDGIGEWLSKEFRDDAEFLRKLKPSLIKARARGETPPSPALETGPLPAAPSTPKKERKGGIPPIAIVGAALVAGIVIAKVIDWRGHAHPRV